MALSFFAGFLSGSEDHYTHSQRYKGTLALDLRNGEEPAPEYNGQYSAELFSQKAASVIENHENHEKVTHTVAQNTQQARVYWSLECFYTAVWQLRAK